MPPVDEKMTNINVLPNGENFSNSYSTTKLQF